MSVDIFAFAIGEVLAPRLDVVELYLIDLLDQHFERHIFINMSVWTSVLKNIYLIDFTDVKRKQKEC